MIDFLLSVLPLIQHLSDLAKPYLPLFVVLGAVSGFVGSVFTVANTIRHW